MKFCKSFLKLYIFLKLKALNLEKTESSPSSLKSVTRFENLVSQLSVSMSAVLRL